MNSSAMDFTMNLTGTLSADKLGVTTTVKEQVENIESALQIFRNAVDQQRKTQNELQIQLKKLDQKTHKDFNEMLYEITSRALQLTDSFRNDNERQVKQFEYLQLQSSILSEEHQKLNDVSLDINTRTGGMENRIGV